MTSGPVDQNFFCYKVLKKNRNNRKKCIKELKYIIKIMKNFNKG